MSSCDNILAFDSDLFRHIYLFTAKKMLSKFRSRDEEQFPPRKNLHRFSKEWKLWWEFSTVTAIFFFRADNPIYGN